MSEDLQRVAFCDQDPWITNSTLRDNIVASTNFDDDWYQSVLRACSLDVDIKGFPAGDECLLGSKGLALSGGQKTRIALARALFARTRLALLDDVLAALDPETEEVLFERVFSQSGLLRQQGSSLMMVTRQLHRLHSFDHVIVLDNNGTITEQGPFATLNLYQGCSRNAINTKIFDMTEQEEEQIGSETTEKVVQAKTLDTKDRRQGDWVIYRYFLSSNGWLNSLFAFSMAPTNGFCIVFSTIWLQKWTRNSNDGPYGIPDQYPIVYALLGVVALISLALFCRHVLVVMIPRAGKNLHSVVLKTMLNAPLSHFTKVDTGVAMNRFSQDMQLLDVNLQTSLINTVEGVVTAFLRLIVVCIYSRYIGATLPVTMLVIYFLQKCYLLSSRQLWLLDIEAKAPLYSHFVETLNGLATIRAYGWQSSFKSRTYEILDSSQKPFYLLACIQRWLTFVLDCLTGSLGLLVVVLAVTLRGKGRMTAGDTGVALVNIVSFNQALAMLIICWTMLETSIGAVTRIRQFERGTESEKRVLVDSDPVSSWPERGAVRIENVTASYRPNSPPALRNVTISVSPGQRIGICGRTGSGKSSLLLALLGLLSIDSGSIVIDNISLSTLALETIRSRLTTVPQDFTLLHEPVRDALDASKQLPDTTLISTLEKVCVWELLRQRQGLDTIGSDLIISKGEQQLFSLARALMEPVSGVVLLDEPCSGVNAKTNAVMQNLINAEFRNRTIVAVEHNLANIVDYDCVVVMGEGRVLETGESAGAASEGVGFQGVVGCEPS